MNDKENIRPNEELQESSYSISVSERNYMKEKILRDFPKDKRKVIFPQRDEIEMENEGEMKVEPYTT